MNNLELHHYRCLVTLAEELNFGRAAARLHMSQPPLTRLLSDVERLVGARLFERTTRRVRLTPVGEVFVAEARVLLTRADATLESVRAAVRRQSGQIRLAYTPLALQTVLPEIMAGLRERDHEVSIDLVELSSPAQRGELRAGHVDMGFADEPFRAGGEHDDAEGFRSLLLHRESLQVLVPDDHPLAEKDGLTLASLEGETFILHARHEYPRYYDRVLEACREAGFTPRIYQREARQNCAALVAAGQGILLSPANLSSLSPPGLRRLPLKDSGQSRIHCEVWAIFPASSCATPHLETLCAAIQARIGAGEAA